MSPDVIIVGGGLSGATTALHLVRAGLAVTIVEQRRFPRDKPCGEGLLPHGVAKLSGLGVGDVFEAAQAQPFRGILYRCHDVVARGDFENQERGFGIRRRVLDGMLHEAAIAAGAERVEATVCEIRDGGDRVNVGLRGGGKLSARFAIGADGPRSVVRHAIGLDAGTPNAGRYAIRQHFEWPSGVALPDHVEVAVLGGFELYVTPVAPGLVGLAALCERSALRAGSGDPAARLQELLARAPAGLRERFVDARPAGQALACGPLRVKTRGVSRGSVLLVGDAAGYVDAITGEGMSLAFSMASLAARAILEASSGRRPVETAFRAYERARARLFRDHAILTHGLVFLARHPWFARRAVARLAREPALFTRLLAVNNGSRSLLSLGIFDALKLAAGSRPAT